MKIQNIPNGIDNLKPLFPTIDFDNIDEYYIEFNDYNGDKIGQSTLNVIGCCCEENIPINLLSGIKTQNVIRLHFINSFGQFDTINFINPEEYLDVKSEIWKKALDIPLDRKDGGLKKYNIKSNENVSAITTCYAESEMYFIKELFSAVQVWQEVVLPNGFKNYEQKELIPIVINDGKFVSRKDNERYVYEVKVQFYYSNDNFHLRG